MIDQSVDTLPLVEGRITEGIGVCMKNDDYNIEMGKDHMLLKTKRKKC